MNFIVNNNNFNSLTLNQQYTFLLNLLTSNRLLIFPPPIVDPNIIFRRLRCFNRRNPRNKSVNGCRLLRHFIYMQGRNINPAIVNSTVIGRVANEFWKTATQNEKADYINLSNQV